MKKEEYNIYKFIPSVKSNCLIKLFYNFFERSELKMAINKFEVFPWSRELEVGIPEVDVQHQKLVELINKLAIQLVGFSDELQLSKVFDELADYADYHFTTEEGVWNQYLKSDDEWTKAHKKVHSSFFEKVAELKDDNIKFEKSIEKILKFLIGWLATHILETDKRMALASLEIKNGKGKEEAKKAAQEVMGGEAHLLIKAVIDMYENLSVRTLELMKEQVKSKKLEETLETNIKHEKSFSDAILKLIPGSIALYNEDFKLLRWNREHEVHMGYSPQDLYRKDLLDFFDGEDTEEVSRMVEELREKRSLEGELELRYKNGEKEPYAFKCVMININGDNYFLVSGINISKQKETQKALDKKTRELKKALKGVIDSISEALELRDPYTAGHQKRVAKIAVAISQKLNMPEAFIEGIDMGARIHDIGKMSIPIELLTKPRKLTDIEYEIVKNHVKAGIDILNSIEFQWPVIKMISEHHERIDGTGYPNGIKGDEICLEAKILAVADVFEAMSSHRPYRPAATIERTLDEIKRYKGIYYDAKVVEALCELIKEDKNRFNR